MTKKVLVLIHSAYGHVKSLAEAEIEGLKAAGVEVKLAKAPELLSDEILAKMYAQKFDLPVATIADLEWADGILFGLSTRFGSAPGQIKFFWDSTGQLWYKGALKGKFFGIFQATACIGGGQESAALTFLPNLVHHGAIFVPVGNHPVIGNTSEVHGGSYWGAGCVAGGDGSRPVSELEKELAKYQGEEFGKLLNRLK